jgi:hypothetical protein
MTFDFHLRFPVQSGGASANVDRTQTSTPGPLNTDPLDLIVWASAAATLEALADGPIRYIPPLAGTTSGALQIFVQPCPWAWATLVNESDYLTPDKLPDSIYYENVDQTTAEQAIRGVIRRSCGNTPPAPEDSLVEDFFAGKWVGRPVQMADQSRIRPIIVRAGDSLGTTRSGPGTPPDPASPNAVIMKLRKSDGTTAVDLVDIAAEAQRECRADIEWGSVLAALNRPVFSATSRSIAGRRFFSVSYLHIQLLRLNSALQTDVQTFTNLKQQGLTPDAQLYLDATNVILAHLADANTLYPPLESYLADPCGAPDSMDFDIETLSYMVDLLHSYRYLLHERFYEWTTYSAFAPLPAEWVGWAMDCDNQLHDLNVSLTQLFADPNWSGRSGIQATLDATETIAAQVHAHLTQSELDFIKTFNQIAGVVLLVTSVVQAAFNLAALAAEIASNGGGFGGGLVLADASVIYPTGLTRALTSAEVDGLVNGGIVTGVNGTIVMMSTKGSNFNPRGKTWQRAKNWGTNRGWRERPPRPNSRAKILEDPNSGRIIRFMPADESPGSPYRRTNLGYWRIENEQGIFQDAEGRVPVFQDQQGRDVALTAANDYGAIEPTQVQLDPTRQFLSNGQEVLDLESATEVNPLTQQTFASEINSAVNSGMTQLEAKQGIAQWLTHIECSAPELQ